MHSFFSYAYVQNLQYPTKFNCHFTAEVLHFLKSLCEKLSKVLSPKKVITVISPFINFWKENWLFLVHDHIDFKVYTKIEINIFDTETDSQYIFLFLSTNISTKFERL